jgi:anti-sigma factor RsiW
MNCSESENNILLYVYGELDEAAESEFRQHLAGCADCRAAVEEYRAVLEASRAVDVSPLPEAAIKSIKQAVRTEIIAGAPVRRWSSFLRYAAAILIVLFVWLLLPGVQDTPGPKRTAMSNTGTTLESTTAGNIVTAAGTEKAAETTTGPRDEVTFAKLDGLGKRINKVNGGVALARAYLGSGGSGGSGRLTRLEGRVSSAKRNLKSILGDE